MAALCTATGCGASAAFTVDHSAPETTASTAQATTPVTTTMEPKPSTPRPTVPATGGKGYSAALSARLLAEGSVPSGFTVQIATTMEPDAGDQRPRADAPCTDSLVPLLSATRLTGTPSAMAAATISNDPSSDHLWVGAEVLRTYSGDGAHQALTDLRTMISHCPSVADVASHGMDAAVFRYAVAPGPQLGDESIHVGCTMTSDSMALECNSVIVRIGSALVAVQEQGNESSGENYLSQIAEAAVRRYQATSS